MNGDRFWWTMDANLRNSGQRLCHIHCSWGKWPRWGILTEDVVIIIIIITIIIVIIIIIRTHSMLSSGINGSLALQAFQRKTNNSNLDQWCKMQNWELYGYTDRRECQCIYSRSVQKPKSSQNPSQRGIPAPPAVTDENLRNNVKCQEIMQRKENWDQNHFQGLQYVCYKH